ncbi:MAG: acetyl-CoA carboxylase biotin carboxyl carrier protein [Candidatus Limnocylindrales bacterium]
MDEGPIVLPGAEGETGLPPSDAAAASDTPAANAATDEAAELIALIDRLEGVLERSGLAELEVGSGGTTIVLRTAGAIIPAPAAAAQHGSPPSADGGHDAPTAATSMEPESSGHHMVVAPLTGLYYSAPSPDAAPYVRVGAQVVVGQVIGLIEAMKLYNEIKSDIAGRVVRMPAENGKLVKAKQALIEVEPS